MGGHRSLPQLRPELAEPRSRTPQTRLRLSNAPVWTCGKCRYLTEWVVRRSRGKKAHAMARWRRPPCHGTGGHQPLVPISRLQVPDGEERLPLLLS
jgi:hypothetical protein